MALMWWISEKNSQGKRLPQDAGYESVSGLAADIRSKSSKLTLSRHARCRMDCRRIDETEVREVLAGGRINEARIERTEKGLSVPLEGITHDRQHVRVVVAPKQNSLVLVTVIDLDTNWPCDCP